MKEVWLKVPGADGFYEVSNLGRVRSWMKMGGGLRKTRGYSRTEYPRVLRGFLDKNGYLVFDFYVGGRQRKVRLARCVLQAFVGPPPSKKHEAAHLDGNKSNNKPTNLKWVTARENAAHKLLHDTRLRGATHGRAKLSEEQAYFVITTLKQYSATKLQELAASYGVTDGCIRAIYKGRSWSHLGNR